MRLVPQLDALQLSAKLGWGRLCTTPLDVGVWALLEPAGLQNHAPQLCWLSEDRLACVWMAGGREGTAGMSIYFSELRAGRGRWSAPRLISQDPQRSEQNPLLFRLASGRLLLMHTAQQARDPDVERVESGSSFSMQWTARLRVQSRRVAGGRWTSARDLITEPAFCRHPPHPLPDGGWILPIYRSLEAGGGFGHDFSLVQHLNADAEPIEDPFVIPNSVGRVHGSIVLSRDGGSFLQFFRSRLADRIYRATSDLDGRIWSEPEPIPLPNNNSSIQAARLKSGRLAIIYNRFCFEPDPRDPQGWGDANWPRTRWPLSLAISEDDGNTWPWIRDLDTGAGFCGEANWMLNGQLAYPSLLEGSDGDLHIAYSWGGRQAIRYICIHEHEVLGT